MTDEGKSYFHRGGDVPFLGATIPEHVGDICRRFPGHEAVVSLPQERRLTYRDLDREVLALARGLLAMGFEKGERIGIWATDNIEWLLLQLATARIGIILVNINPAYRVEELAYALKKSEVQGVFAIPSFRSSDYVAMLCDILPGLSEDGGKIETPDLPHMRKVVLYDPSSPHETARPHPGFTLWQEVLNAGEKVGEAEVDAVTQTLDRDDPINIQYTSGTTGFPKAVLLTHHNILNNAYFSALAMRFDENDRLCVPVPFYHCFGMVLANLLCLSVGACLVIPSEHFDAPSVLKAVEAEKCTAVHGVPTMFIAELEHPDFAKYDLTSLRTGIMAGAPCPPELMKRVIEEEHCPEILIGYGETEASPLTHLTSADDSFEHRIETVGRNLPHQEVKIIHTKTGQTVPLGEIGEICFRGYHIMRGYYGDEKATRKTVDESGWLFSGDLGAMDAQGYVKITGRLKEMVIRGGENIYPREIEEVIFAHPEVVQVAVFGVPDDFYGEELMAWVQLHQDKKLSEEDLRTYCKDHLAHFKVPRYIRFVDEFPMTVTGKLQKFRMRDMALEEMKAKPS